MSIKTPTYLLAILLFALMTLLSTATPTPAQDTDTTLPEVELAAVNAKTIPIAIPFYQFSEDGQTPLEEIEANGWLQCETSGGSPWVWDIAGAAQKVRDSMAWCIQDNPGGSKCKTHARYGTASLGVCGTVLVATRCYNLALVADQVVAQCRVGDQAGGQFFFTGLIGSLKAIVY